MKADLHVHSYYSDGTSSPEELLALALKHQITDLAVVDHDSCAGIDECKKVFASSPINFIEGVEISAYDFKRDRKVHILGYNLINTQYVEQLCAPLLASRTKNTLKQLRRIQREGFQITEEQVRDFAQEATALYKQHIMNALVQAGYESDLYGPLYKKLFKNNGIVQMDIEYIDVYDAIEAIKLGGGMAVVAHPGQLDSYDLIPELASFGLDGIEKYHPDHTLKDQRRVQELVDTFKIHSFGGSDFHGKNGPDYFGESAITVVREFPDVLLLKQRTKVD